MKQRARARYFCEKCGTEVRAGAATCPSCGSVFTAVRCPECGYEGRAPEFHAGCPVCGYQAQTGDPARQAPVRSKHGKRRAVVPPGFYRIAIAVLGALIVGLVVLLVLRA